MSIHFHVGNNLCEIKNELGCCFIIELMTMFRSSFIYVTLDSSLGPLFVDFVCFTISFEIRCCGYSVEIGDVSLRGYISL